MPVQDFLNGLDKKSTAKLITRIDYVKEYNIQVREPYAKHMEDKLWELRAETMSGLYRIFYAIVPTRRIVLLHAFKKSERKTPLQDLQVARDRLAEYLQSQNN